MLSRHKPENCNVLSHHSNNKTNVLPTFQVHNLLTDTLLLSTFFIHKKRCKIFKRIFILKNKNVRKCFFHLCPKVSPFHKEQASCPRAHISWHVYSLCGNADTDIRTDIPNYHTHIQCIPIKRRPDTVAVTAINVIKIR